MHAKHLLAKVDTALGALKGNVLGVKRVNRNHNAFQTGLFEALASRGQLMRGALGPLLVLNGGGRKV